MLRKLLERMGPIFDEGGKLSRFKPVFQALKSILFAAPELAHRSPFGRDPLDVKRYMSLVIMAAFPCLVAAVYFFGWRILLMLLVSYVAGAVVEVAFAVIRKHEVNEGFLVTGFLFPLILPPATPLWLVAVGVIFGVLVGKEVFGGTGRNLFNPALVGRIFIALAYPSVMMNAWVQPATGGWGRIIPARGIIDTLTTATPLVAAKGGVVAAPLDLFLGRVMGSAGETSAVAIILGGILLLITGIASWRTMLAVLVSFVGLTAILHAALPDKVAPVLFSLLSGGFLFGAVFMATDPVSSPVTQSAKWGYGLIIGASVVLIRSFSGFVEGMMFAILLGDIFAPLLDEVVIRSRVRRYAREK